MPNSIVRCSHCNCLIYPGESNGLPNGIGMVLEGGKKINICQQCLIDVGMMSKTQKDKFFEGLERGDN